MTTQEDAPPGLMHLSERLGLRAGDARGQAHSAANLAMLRQLYANLRVLHDLCHPDPEDAAAQERLRRAGTLLAPAADPQAPGEAFRWTDAYLAEQLLVPALPEAELRVDLVRRAAALGAEASGAAKGLARQVRTILEADPLPLDRARSLLLRLVSETQWKTTQRMQLRRMAQVYRRRINIAFLVSLLLFLSLLFVSPNLNSLEWTRGTGGGYSGLLTGVVAGLFGAGFSALAGSRKLVVDSIEDMESLIAPSQILLRMLVGAGGAAIVYFLFETGLITGAAIPDLDRLGFDPVKLDFPTGMGPLPADDARFGVWTPNKEVSLLMVWSFLAGFSESLVPRMLTQVESSASAGGGGERRGSGGS